MTEPEQPGVAKARKLLNLANVECNDSCYERDNALRAAIGVIEKHRLLVGNSGIQPTVNSAQDIVLKWVFWILSEFGAMSRAWLKYYLQLYRVTMTVRELDHLLEAMVSVGFLFGRNGLICVNW